MKEMRQVADVRGVAVVNLQKHYAVPTASLLSFARNLKRRLRLGTRKFNICLVDDHAIRHLNLAYRGKDRATDVLSFPWNDAATPLSRGPLPASRRRERVGITDFLGDVVISVPTARRNAGEEGHSTLNEIRWLILHGVLHLLGYDHESDAGEMVALELALREQLGVAGGTRRETIKSKVKMQKAKVKRQIRGPLNF
ncbi:MAG: rRNA maturation RNase YbeY [Terriglobia bacterium]